MTPLVLSAPLVLAAPLWRTIPQPLVLRVLVAAVGLVLIAAELWWFLGRHGGDVVASEGEQGVQEITIAVDGGYSPSQIRVKAGRPVRLRFHRTDPSGCVAQVIFPDFQRTLDLPLGATTSIELLPTRPGPYPFHCGMNMVRGSIEAE
ncbi:cupredoxin domain-containing protein [Cyanobium gracile UHCC 0139]|uniref:Cupredoxin domain-containing protein n=1 Tax=Cyanobium gracile UHCC 0139 TaxID=3110308 RepID=A0ABU5RX11_9CYAN|nr:cupredoxin domain-containing protein [Cyanobium gracile]MEA5392325.1 cupredoxin domain-containing protein [Cyanobium gracile UHCC 0139]